MFEATEDRVLPEVWYTIIHRHVDGVPHFLRRAVKVSRCIEGLVCEWLSVTRKPTPTRAEKSLSLLGCSAITLSGVVTTFCPDISLICCAWSVVREEGINGVERFNPRYMGRAYVRTS